MAGDSCDLIHPPIKSPFAWCYKMSNDTEYKFCSVDLNTEIEKSFCDPSCKTFL